MNEHLELWRDVSRAWNRVVCDAKSDHFDGDEEYSVDRHLQELIDLQNATEELLASITPEDSLGTSRKGEWGTCDAGSISFEAPGHPSGIVPELETCNDITIDGPPSVGDIERLREFYPSESSTLIYNGYLIKRSTNGKWYTSSHQPIARGFVAMLNSRMGPYEGITIVATSSTSEMTYTPVTDQIDTGALSFLGSLANGEPVAVQGFTTEGVQAPLVAVHEIWELLIDQVMALVFSEMSLAP